MEIRTKVCEYVRQKILSLRSTAPNTDNPLGFQNVSVCRANTMRYAINFFGKGQLQKVFICFPDPHFKVGWVCKRSMFSSWCIISMQLLRPKTTGGVLSHLRCWMNTRSFSHLVDFCELWWYTTQWNSMFDRWHECFSEKVYRDGCEGLGRLAFEALLSSSTLRKGTGVSIFHQHTRRQLTLWVHIRFQMKSCKMTPRYR